MFCGNCGHFVPISNNFCSRCGTPMSKNFSTSEDQDLVVITAQCETIDYTNHSELTSIFSRITRKRILLDLTKVTFIDSTGIGTIVTLYYKTNRTKQQIYICGVNPQIMSTIKALSVDNLLQIYETSEKACEAWGLKTV